MKQLAIGGLGGNVQYSILQLMAGEDYLGAMLDRAILPTVAASR